MFSAKYDYKLNNDSKLYGRLGFAQVKVTNDQRFSGSGTFNGMNSRGSSSYSSTKTVPVLGVGYEYAFTKSFALRGEYTYIDKVGDDNTGSSAVNMLTVQTVFKF